MGSQHKLKSTPLGLVPADQGLATNHAKPEEAAPHPTSRRWKPGLATRNRKAFEARATVARSCQTQLPLA